MLRKYLALVLVFAVFIAVAALLVRFCFDRFPHYGGPKMALATGYLLAAVLMGALNSRLGRWLLLGLACAWWGDFLLMGPKDTFFLAGLLAFLAGHLCYCVAYATHGARARVVLPSLAVLAIPGMVLVWNLWPGIPAGLRVPVMLYLTAITLMVALSFGCIGRPAGWILVLGALLFYLSDMGVSSRAFGGADMAPFKSLAPLYFPGQYLLAVAIPVARRAAGKTPQFAK